MVNVLRKDEMDLPEGTFSRGISFSFPRTLLVSEYVRRPSFAPVPSFLFLFLLSDVNLSKRSFAFSRHVSGNLQKNLTRILSHKVVLTFQLNFDFFENTIIRDSCDVRVKKIFTKNS